jgi:catalase-peroxidase
MGPRERLGLEKVNEKRLLLWQDPIPVADYTIIDAAAVTGALKSQILVAFARF